MIRSAKLDVQTESFLLVWSLNSAMARSIVEKFRFLAFIMWFCSATQLAAATESTIAATFGQQVYEWEQLALDVAPLEPYYSSVDGRAVWISDGQPTEAARDLLHALSNAHEDGLDGRDYLSRQITDFVSASSEKDSAGFELAMSQAFFGLARDLSSGRTSPSVTAPDIIIGRKPANVVRWLSLVRDQGLEAALAEIRPKHRQYYQLRRMLNGYRALAERGGWPAVTPGSTLKPGMTDLRVAELRANLLQRGYSGIESPEPEFFDAELAAAIEHFQKRHGLETDSLAGPATIKALNVTAAERVNQIVINMERWRWLPSDLGSKHVFVNQAAFEMFFHRDGVNIDRRRVIVGKPYHKTPMFSDIISYADFNPTWTVPPSIALNEFLPKILKDPGYLERNGYTVFAGWSENSAIVDPWSVDWSQLPPGKFPFKIVQQPGPKNALGQVKFIFPNKFNIYLHDTPSRQLFASTGRAFSHGCIRVQEPIRFAELLFESDGSLSPSAIRIILESGKTRRALLQKGVPIHLAYFTAWIDEEGLPHFYEDIYERDALIARILFESA